MKIKSWLFLSLVFIPLVSQATLLGRINSRMVESESTKLEVVSPIVEAMSTLYAKKNELANITDPAGADQATKDANTKKRADVIEEIVKAKKELARLEAQKNLVLSNEIASGVENGFGKDISLVSGTSSNGPELVWKAYTFTWQIADAASEKEECEGNTKKSTAGFDDLSPQKKSELLAPCARKRQAKLLWLFRASADSTDDPTGQLNQKRFIPGYIFVHKSAKTEL